MLRTSHHLRTMWHMVPPSSTLARIRQRSRILIVESDDGGFFKCMLTDSVRVRLLVCLQGKRAFQVGNGTGELNVIILIITVSSIVCCRCRTTSSTTCGCVGRAVRFIWEPRPRMWNGRCIWARVLCIMYDLFETFVVVMLGISVRVLSATKESICRTGWLTSHAYSSNCTLPDMSL